VPYELAFGLVSIPVSLRRAVDRRRVRFHELHDADGGRIRRRAACSLDGAPVTREHIVRGYELERGRWVTVTADELQALAPRAPTAHRLLHPVLAKHALAGAQHRGDPVLRLRLGHRGQADGRLLGGGLALLRGDDDLFELSRVGTRLLGQRDVGEYPP